MSKSIYRLVLSAFMLCLAAPVAAVTLGECVRQAEANYPLVSKYKLLEQTNEVNLSDINKGWLPGITVYGQATIQNEVPSFPDALKDVMAKLGHDFKGLSPFQYKAGVDLQQTIWDGGMSKAGRKIQRASTEVQRNALDVELYGVRERVEDLYFGILLIDEQTAQSELTLRQLESNRDKLTAMLRNGVAMQSDVDQLEAQILTISQQIAQARRTAESYRQVLGLFIGMDLDGQTLERPSAEMPVNMEPERPEQSLFDSRLRLAETQRAAVTASLMPKAGFFAQAYYGYPRIDYFRSMRDRTPGFNALAGVKIQWEIGAFYTRRDKLTQIHLDKAQTEADRETFLFNNKLAATSQTGDIDAIRRVMADDERIVQLRRNVRRAAESQLENGVIDTFTLINKITDENRAEMTARYHEIELLKKIHQLRTTLNK